MSWGTELWDRYDAMCTYTSSGVDFLDNSVARFMKERSIIETEYAKKLRKLVKDFSPKDMPSEGGGSANTLKVERSTSRASKNGTLKRNKRGAADDQNKSGPASLGGAKKRGREDEYSHMSAYKQVRISIQICRQIDIWNALFDILGYLTVTFSCRKYQFQIHFQIFNLLRKNNICVVSSMMTAAISDFTLLHFYTKLIVRTYFVLEVFD